MPPPFPPLNRSNSHPDLVHCLLVLPVVLMCVYKWRYCIQYIPLVSFVQHNLWEIHIQIITCRVVHAALVCSILLYQYTTVCYFYCWWTFLLPVLVIMNKATMWDIYFLFLFDAYLGMGLLGCKVDVCLTSVDTAKKISRSLYQYTWPSAI